MERWLPAIKGSGGQVEERVLQCNGAGNFKALFASLERGPVRRSTLQVREPAQPLPA